MIVVMVIQQVRAFVYLHSSLLDIRCHVGDRLSWLSFIHGDIGFVHFHSIWWMVSVSVVAKKSTKYYGRYKTSVILETVSRAQKL